MAAYVLYTAQDKRDATRQCIGSNLCIGLLEYLPESSVDVKNCDDMRRSNAPFPTWLIGTPTLVSVASSEIFRGQQAVRHLQDVVVTYVERTARTASSSTAKDTSRHANPPQYVPSHAHSQSGEDEPELSELWEVGIVSEEDGESNGMSRKVTGDDLAKEVARRQQSMTQTIPAAPPPPPPSERD